VRHVRNLISKQAAANIGKSRQVASGFLDARDGLGCWSEIAAGDGYRDLRRSFPIPLSHARARYGDKLPSQPACNVVDAYLTAAKNERSGHCGIEHAGLQIATCGSVELEDI
jgi:hypothetical protein